MVFDGDEATATILAAAERADCRVLLQSGYSQLGGGAGRCASLGARVRVRVRVVVRVG